MGGRSILLGSTGATMIWMERTALCQTTFTRRIDLIGRIVCDVGIQVRAIVADRGDRPVCDNGMPLTPYPPKARSDG